MENLLPIGWTTRAPLPKSLPAQLTAWFWIRTALLVFRQHAALWLTVQCLPEHPLWRLPALTPPNLTVPWHRLPARHRRCRRTLLT